MYANMEAMQAYMFKEQENKGPCGSRVRYEKQRSINLYKKGEEIVTCRLFSSLYTQDIGLYVLKPSMHSERCMSQGLIREAEYL